MPTKRNVYIAPGDYENQSIRQKFMDSNLYNVINTGNQQVTKGSNASPYQFTSNDLIIGGTGAVGGIGAGVNTNGATRLWGPDGAATAAAVGGYKDYANIAESQVMPTYNSNVQAINQATQQKNAALQQSMVGINQNYDTQVGNQNRQNMLNKNNFSNNVNSRGLGRSTIATSGMAGMDNTNNRIASTIESYRTGALSGVNSQIADNTSYGADQLRALEMDKASKIAAASYDMQTKDTAAALEASKYQNETDWRQKVFDDTNSDQATAIATHDKEYADAQAWKQKEYALSVSNAAASRAASAASAASKNTPKPLTATESSKMLNDAIGQIDSVALYKDGDGILQRNPNYNDSKLRAAIIGMNLSDDHTDALLLRYGLAVAPGPKIGGAGR